MEKLQNLCDRETGHDPFHPLGPVYQQATLPKIQNYGVYALLWLVAIVALPLKLLAIPLGLIMGLSPNETAFAVSQCLLWRPLAYSLGMRRRVFVNMVSRTNEPAILSCPPSLSPTSYVIAPLTSRMDVLFWVTASPSKPVFAFGCLPGGFVLVSDINRALNFASSTAPFKVTGAEGFKENHMLDACTNYFSSLGPLVHLAQKRKVGPLVIFPQTQRSNGSALLPWSVSLNTNAGLSKFDEALLNDLSQFNPPLSVFQAKQAKRDKVSKAELFVAVPVFDDGSQCPRELAFADCILEGRDYDAHQTGLGGGKYRLSLASMDDMQSAFSSLNSIKELEEKVVAIQQSLYTATFNADISPSALLVTKSSKLSRCQEISPDAMYEYRHQYLKANATKKDN